MGAKGGCMITVYHGSTTEIKTPIVNIGWKGLDFGQGFYLTDIPTQAEEWARRMADRRKTEAILNVYTFDLDKAKSEYRYMGFTAYDKKWLDFIAQSRSGGMPFKDYDIIEGGIANDRVVDTVEAYIAELISADKALEELARHQPNNQICILNQDIVDKFLVFKESNKV